MRIYSFIICFVFIAFLVSCNFSSNNKKVPKPNQKDSAHNEINEESVILSRFLKDKVGDAAKAKALPVYHKDSLNAICIVSTRKLDIHYLRIHENMTKEKNIIINKNNYLRDSISLFVDGNKIFALEKRMLKGREVFGHDIFIFGENNDCIGRSTHKKEWNNSFQDALYNDSVVRSDKNERIFLINHFEKQQIIQSAKASLDSIMQRFPEFKYSFNWK